jgi:hypothetical protein
MLDLRPPAKALSSADPSSWGGSLIHRSLGRRRAGLVQAFDYSPNVWHPVLQLAETLGDVRGAVPGRARVG